MSYWSVGVSQATMDTHGDMGEREEDGLGREDDMGAKASLAGGPRGGTSTSFSSTSSASSSSSSCLDTSASLENIQAAYEDGEQDAALELIQQACCVECSAGTAQRHQGVSGPCRRSDLLNWMLSTACRRGHLEVVRLLVQVYSVDTRDCGIHSDQFAVITGLPLYAAAETANEDIACFLLQSGAGFSSYTLMDHPAFSKQLLRQRLEQTTDTQGNEVLKLCWSSLNLPWLELDWFMDLSCRLTHIDLSSNALTTLPSMVPWGLVQLRTLDLSKNQLRDLPPTHSSQEVICTRYDNIMDLGMGSEKGSAEIQYGSSFQSNRSGQTVTYLGKFAFDTPPSGGIGGSGWCSLTTTYPARRQMVLGGAEPLELDEVEQTGGQSAQPVLGQIQLP
ncbi:hypothetical protein CRUP_019431 [Coryphaenoides rupestris]|nr:hypothetical protein CRUP_019431 [Coryphaenoides rupestris]